jgi:hypothetical protein
MLFAGTGSSVLSAAGSGANNVLVGGSGVSVLTGGSGQDILIGGGGPANLHAGTGGDVLIGGSTTWDTNLIALATLLGEWDITDPYQTRVQDLFGNGSGGSNAPYLLDPHTVLRDMALVSLFGDTNGGDWLWFAAGLKSPNRISRFANGDAATCE